MSTAAKANPALQATRSFDATLASAASSIAFAETFQLAIDSFRASKVRFLLTMLGMIIGSASIILVITVGLTGKQYALDTISSIGPNKVEMLYSGGNIAGPDNTSTPDLMTRDDMKAVQDQVPGVVYASPMLEFSDDIRLPGGRTQQTKILGVSPQYKDIRNFNVVAGRFFDDQDAAQHAKAAIILAPFATQLFGSPEAAVNQDITINSIHFTIVGVFAERVSVAQGYDEIGDQTILIPYEVARYFTGTDTVKEIFFAMANSDMVTPAAAQITKVIQSRHRSTSVYKADTLVEILQDMAKIANMLTIVLSLAAVLTIIVSGVGIMNSMLANVSARTREIGIRKALGATAKEIRLQFLTEAVFLSLAGGIIGTIIGLAIPLGAGLFTPVKIPVNYWSAVIALFTSVMVGVFFGMLPATRASRLDPVETLKYE
jgi:putative ABC transport system permease protein